MIVVYLTLFVWMASVEYRLWANLRVVAGKPSDFRSWLSALKAQL